MAIPWHCLRHSLLRRILWQCHNCCADLPLLFLQHPREDDMMLFTSLRSETIPMKGRKVHLEVAAVLSQPHRVQRSTYSAD